MKYTESYWKKTKEASGAEEIIKQKGEAKLADVNSEGGLANPSFMLWALLGLSAEHSYLLMPLS